MLDAYGTDDLGKTSMLPVADTITGYAVETDRVYGTTELVQKIGRPE